MWISVKERYPEHSKVVLITDGKNISTAHWFAHRYNPNKNMRDSGPAWVNQHSTLTGWVDEPTHWMEPTDLLRELSPKEAARG